MVLSLTEGARKSAASCSFKRRQKIFRALDLTGDLTAPSAAARSGQCLVSTRPGLEALCDGDQTRLDS